MATLFLSHSSKDKQVARRLARDLITQGHRVWFDEWDIHVGESIPTRLEAGIEQAEFLVVLLSRHSVASRWVDQEWRTAHWAEVQQGRVAVLPVRLEECAIPPFLQAKKYADLSTSYSQGMDDLLAAVQYFESLKKDDDFYRAIPKVWAEDRKLGEQEKLERAEHWDHFRAVVNLLPTDRQLHVQRENTQYYLREYGLTVRQLKDALQRLGALKGLVDDELDVNLINSLLQFQVLHNLRHHDGVFGPLTYLKMSEVAQQLRTGA